MLDSSFSASSNSLNIGFFISDDFAQDKDSLIYSNLPFKELYFQYKPDIECVPSLSYLHAYLTYNTSNDPILSERTSILPMK